MPSRIVSETQISMAKPFEDKEGADDSCVLKIIDPNCCAEKKDARKEEIDRSSCVFSQAIAKSQACSQHTKTDELKRIIFSHKNRAE
jgi:hypothetical protein